MSDTTGEREPHRVPEAYSSITIHHMYGISEPQEGGNVDAYFQEKEFAFIADLRAQGFTSQQIEESVNAIPLHHAPWPARERATEFFWVEGEGFTRLAELADTAVRLCFGQDEKAPMGGNFATVGAEIGSQQLAIAGLIYGREKGILREIRLGANSAGPLYVVRDSFAGRMLETMVPEGDYEDDEVESDPE